MAINRIRTTKRTHPYIMLDKTSLEDARLSFMAKGIHAYLMSKPDRWVVRYTQLEKSSPTEGRESIRSAMKELEDAGYISRELIRDAAGRLHGMEIIVHETPGQQRLDMGGSPPNDGKPSVGSPSVGKPQLVNNDSSQYGGSKEREKKTLSSKPAVSPESVSELIEGWNQLPGSEGLPKVSARGAKSPTLRKKIALRLQEHPDEQFWNEVLNRCWQTPFLKGEKGGWRATLHWLVENDVNALKVYEGNYNALR